MVWWRPGQTAFRAGLHYDDGCGCMTTLPKPVLEFLGNPEHPVIKITKPGRVTILAEAET